jgi:hypothetical protein
MPSHFTQDKTPVPIKLEAGWDSEPICMIEEGKKPLPYRDSNPGMSSPNPSHYTNYVNWLQRVILDKNKPTDKSA